MLRFSGANFRRHRLYFSAAPRPKIERRRARAAGSSGMSAGSPAIHTKPVSRAAVNSARSGTTHAAGLVSNNGPASVRGIAELPALLLPLVNVGPPDAKGTHHRTSGPPNPRSESGTAQHYRP